MLTRLSLRARLVLAVIVLAALGLGVADVATYTSLRSFLFTRADASLDDAHVSIEGLLGKKAAPEPPPGVGGGQQGLARAAPGDCVELRTLAGRILSRVQCKPQFSQTSALPKPRLPATIAPPTKTSGRDRVRYFTVAAVKGSGRYRVRASIEGRLPNDLLVVAAPLNGVDSTLHRLLLIELVATAAVLAAIAVLGLWVVRLGLRPLRAIEQTAGAIAGGDLSKRVERSDERTEVGRLGLALNAMLGQIESAFNAREASEQKLRRFVADASHELRTPLAAVRAYAELFTRGAERRPEDLARSMSGIRRESERMSLLVEDLLLLAHLDEGRPLAHEPVQLDELVSESVETAQTVEPDRPIRLEAEAVTVLGDRNRLRQIVDNLLGNARAHTPATAPVRVTVAQANGHALIEVHDSGPGMAADELERVFERFYRTDTSRSRASGGVGLGLSIVAAVAEAHGGTASVSAEANRGASFRVTLPLPPRSP
jgi:two-component system OmpR family sensor kinase